MQQDPRKKGNLPSSTRTTYAGLRRKKITVTSCWQEDAKSLQPELNKYNPLRGYKTRWKLKEEIIKVVSSPLLMFITFKHLYIEGRQRSKAAVDHLCYLTRLLVTQIVGSGAPSASLPKPLSCVVGLAHFRDGMLSRETWSAWEVSPHKPHGSTRPSTRRHTWVDAFPSTNIGWVRVDWEQLCGEGLHVVDEWKKHALKAQKVTLTTPYSSLQALVVSPIFPLSSLYQTV